MTSPAQDPQAGESAPFPWNPGDIASFPTRQLPKEPASRIWAMIGEADDAGRCSFQLCSSEMMQAERRENAERELRFREERAAAELSGQDRADLELGRLLRGILADPNPAAAELTALASEGWAAYVQSGDCERFFRESEMSRGVRHEWKRVARAVLMRLAGMGEAIQADLEADKIND